MAKHTDGGCLMKTSAAVFPAFAAVCMPALVLLQAGAEAKIQQFQFQICKAVHTALQRYQLREYAHYTSFFCKMQEKRGKRIKFGRFRQQFWFGAV